MRRLVTALLTTGLLLAAAARSALLQAQVAPAPSPADKKASDGANPAVGTPKDAIGTTKEGADVQKAVAKKPAETKKAHVIEAKAVEVKQAIRARNRRVAVGKADGNLGPMVQQYMQQGRPAMRSEVLLVYSLYHPPKDKLRALAKGAEAGLQAVAKEMAEYQQGAHRIMMNGQNAKNPEWAKKLQQTIAVEFKKYLTPEQFAGYQSEVEMRFAEQKEAGLRFLVDAIDRELLLSPKQRDQVLRILGPRWEDGWTTYLEYLMYGNQFFPQEVDRLVTPILDETQKKVWQGAQKVSAFWGFGVVWGMQNAQDPLQELLADGEAKPAGDALAPDVTKKKGAAARPAAKK
jgi:hypothetical protein